MSYGAYGNPSTPQGGQGGSPQHGNGWGHKPQKQKPPKGPQNLFGPQMGHQTHMPGSGFEQRGGAKKALICACNYAGTPSALRGCINDAKCMAFLLENKFGFSKEYMRILLDDSRDPRQMPTRHNIFDGIQWLLSGAQAGDSLFFHFSGHGSQQRDPTGLESDGLNETLCPTDFKSAGQIIDDELNARLINPLPQGVQLHVVVDACHSGSVMDLEYLSTACTGAPTWKNEYAVRPTIYKGTSGGRAVQFGAATDDQTAADTNALSGNVSTGAATFSFIQAIERAGTQISYGALLHEMHKSLKEVKMKTGGGSGAGLNGCNPLAALMTGGSGGGGGVPGAGGGPSLSSLFGGGPSSGGSLFGGGSGGGGMGGLFRSHQGETQDRDAGMNGCLGALMQGLGTGGGRGMGRGGGGGGGFGGMMGGNRPAGRGRGSSFANPMSGAIGGGSLGGLMSLGMALMGQRGGDLGDLLSSLLNASNTQGWKQQTPVLASNEAFDFNMPIQL